MIPQATEGSFDADGAGERLDRALQPYLPDLSRTALQRLIEEGSARVNGKREKPGYRLRRGDTVSWRRVEAAPVPTTLVPEEIPLDVLYEDGEVLVINKPRDLVVHPAPGHATGTLVHAVLAHAPEDLTGIGGEHRPGIVHRLDKDTSGAMVIAKTERSLAALQAQIAARSMERRYLALVWGSPGWERAVVDAPIGRHPVDRKRMAVVPPGSPRTHREARTEFRVLERFSGFTLVEAKLETGRTHQVRVHAAYVKLPVVGDATYGPSGVTQLASVPPEIRAAVAALGGQALHAYRLSFSHPDTEQPIRILAPLPGDYAALLGALGSRWQVREDDPWPGG